MHHKFGSNSLAGGGLGLGGGTLGTLLANDTTGKLSVFIQHFQCDEVDVPAGGLASSRLGGGLGLLSLLDALGGSALLLALLDGGLAGSRAGLGTL